MKNEIDNRMFTVAGALLCAISAGRILYGINHDKEERNILGSLASGLIGVVAGLAITAVPPIKKEVSKLSIQGEILEDEDVENVEAQIGEVLGNSVERGQTEVNDNIPLDTEDNADNLSGVQ